MRVEPKPTVSLSHASSHAWRILAYFIGVLVGFHIVLCVCFFFGCDSHLILALRDSTEKRSVMNSNKGRFISI